MNYTSVRSGGNRLFVRTSDRQNLTIKNANFKPDIYLETDKVTPCKFKTIRGQQLSHIQTDNIKDSRDKCADYSDLMRVYAQSNIAYEYIRKQFTLRGCAPLTQDQVYGLNIDIETGRDERGYSSTDEARCPVTGITIKDSRNDIYRTWSTKEIDKGRLAVLSDEYFNLTGYRLRPDQIVYIQCDDEKDMMLRFVEFWINDYPDYLTGWNTTGYDLPYIINRLIVIFGEDIGRGMATNLSPFKSLHEKEIRHYNKVSKGYDIVGINDLDYITLYKKFTYGGRVSYKLDDIGEYELGRQKISYEDLGNLQNLFDQDFTKFIFYNVIDVDIVECIDKKLTLVNLVMSLAYKTGANWTDMVSPVKTWDIFIYNYLADRNIMIPFSVPKVLRPSYVGAFVKEPDPRRYRKVGSFDLNALYPHLQMQFNISPDMHIPYKDLPKELQDYVDNTIPSDTVFAIDWMLEEKLDTDLLIKHNVTMTPNGEFWKRGEDGFIPKILNGLYAERSASKKKMLSLEQEIENNVYTDDVIPAIKNEIARLDTLQMALKILMNSEYGAMANEYFRHFSIEIAEGITSAGQLAIQWAGTKLDLYLNKMCGTERVEYVFYMDTDSLYVEFDILVQKYFPKNLSAGETITMLDKVCKEKIEPEIDKIYQQLATYTNAHAQKMVMKREVLADNGIWTAKKRYALNVFDSEGVRFAEPKVKIMGLESVRSSIPQPCRDAYKDAVKLSLTKDEKDVQDYVTYFEAIYKNDDIHAIAFPRGVNNIEKWVGGDGVPKSGCPVHVRATIVFNNYLTKNGIVDYEKIQSGDKIKFVYLKDENPLMSHVVGFPSLIPSKLYDIIVEHLDYDKQFEKSFLTPIDNLLSVVGWKAEYENDLMSFFV